ncbi:MAG TPA: TIGR01906 family membrane protein, partial [Arthrobacter sp.]
MNDNSPIPAKRTEPQPDPDLDSSSDTDEPAFAWLKEGSSTPEASPAGRSGAEQAGASQPESRADRKAAEAAVVPSSVEPPAVVPTVEESLRKEPATSGGTRNGAHFSEPLPTSALQVR